MLELGLRGVGRRPRGVVVVRWWWWWKRRKIVGREELAVVILLDGDPWLLVWID